MRNNSPRTASNRVVRYRRIPKIHHLTAAETSYSDRVEFVRRLWWLNTFRIAPEHAENGLVPEPFAESFQWDLEAEWLYHPTYWEHAIINNEPANVVNCLLTYCRDQLPREIQRTESAHWINILQLLRRDYVDRLPEGDIQYLLNQPEYRDCSQDR